MALRVALVGMGRIGKTHLRALSGTTAAEVIGIYDQDQSRARESADAAGVGRVYATWQQVLGDDSVQCVGVLLPHDLHEQYAVDALQAGKNVVCEKPMGPTLPERRDLSQLSVPSASRTICRTGRSTSEPSGLRSATSPDRSRFEILGFGCWALTSSQWSITASRCMQRCDGWRLASWQSQASRVR